MKILLILLVVAFMGLTLYSLLRGLNAFRMGLDDDAARAPGSGPSELQLKQNKMMFARIKYQAAAVLVVALLLAFAR